MATDLPESLRELASMQCGVASRQQILNGGVTKTALIWQLRRAHWQQLQRGVYALFSGDPSREAELWAAVLRAGPGAVLSHHTAAELLRLTDRPSELVHVTVPGHRRVQPIPGFAIHLSDSVARTRHPGLLPPRTRIEDTVLDLANLAGTFDDACGWLTRALGRRLTTEQHVLTALAARSRQRWRAPLTQMLTAPGGGVHSVLEFRYYRHVERAHRLPPATRQVRVAGPRRIAYRDAYYAKYQVVVELDGQLAHPIETRWRDIRRDNAAAADGSITLRYGWSDVTRNPCGTAGELARVLIQRGWIGMPILCSPTCSVAAGWLTQDDVDKVSLE